MSYVTISQDDGTLGGQTARLTRTATGGPLYRAPADAADTARLLRARGAGLLPAARRQLAPPAWGVMPYGVTLDPDAGLGFSLKPPKWVRKMQPGKILKKVALPLAAVGAALLVPGLAPVLAKGAIGAGKLVLGGGKLIAGSAGKLVLGGGRLVGRAAGTTAGAAASAFQSTMMPVQVEPTAAAPMQIGQPMLTADPPIITQREMEMVDRSMATPMLPPSPELRTAVEAAPLVIAGLAALALFGVARGASRAVRR